MEVILLERVDKLGQMGEVVRVKDGYARNFLLPQGKALRANKGNMARFEKERAQLEARNLERRQEAETVAGRMTDFSVVLLRQAGESGQLYGSVSARDIADAATEAGASLGREQVRLERPIKTLGLHDVRVDLHPEVTVEIQVNVARSAEEAEVQARGGDPTAMPEDDDEDEDYEAEDLQDEVEGLGPQPDVDLPVDEQEEQARQ
ncbi:50S ribosomal protein L9 [Marinibaculum pumilum]|uniref:Large ribosomal subunit protein bL9 n=1 Tax=Marinibaculum pumilum TaxID=1766165 RepID=A0ABV7KTK7_9PROT